MSTKRFGVGILVGLGLALAVVASSGLASSTYRSASTDNAILATTTQGATSTVTNAATTVTTAATTAATSATTTTAGTASAISSATGTSNGGSIVAGVPSTNSSSTGTQYGPQKSAQNPAPIDALYPSSTDGAAFRAPAAPADTLASRPASVAWLVFIPIAVALVLGLVLYRSSAGRLTKD